MLNLETKQHLHIMPRMAWIPKISEISWSDMVHMLYGHEIHCDFISDFFDEL